MCILDVHQFCGGGDPAIFVAPSYSSIFNLNNVRRCPASFMPSQGPLNCPFFRIRHGYEPTMRDCTACTNAIKSRPPPFMRQAPVLMTFGHGRYDDGPCEPTRNPRGHPNERTFIPGLSGWVPSRAETNAADSASDPAAAQRQQAGLTSVANHPPDIYNPPAQRPLPTQQSHTPAIPPRSNSRNRNANQVAELTKLLEESLDCNEVLTKANEELKTENANLKSWMAQNGPMYSN